MTKAKHIFGPAGYHMWQVTVLGVPVRSGINFPTIEEAAFNCQLFKHYLRQEFRMDFDESLDGEVFAMIAYRLSVSLPDSPSVLSALPDNARTFISEHGEKLAAHRDSVPVSVAEKFRRSGMIEIPAIREWVNKCEAASILVKEYATVNSSSFFTRLSVVEKSLDTSLKTLALAVRLHGSSPPTSLQPRVDELTKLIEHLRTDLDYVRELGLRLRHEEDAVMAALPALEAARPPLS